MRVPIRPLLAVAGVCAATALTLSAQAPTASPQPPAAQPTQAPQPAAGGGGRGGGRGQGQGGPGKADPVNASVDWTKQEPVLPKTPAEEQKLFLLQPGYRMELVLADPDIREPTSITFDGNGRMFVLENRGYMQDADATGELDPVGRISVHTDTNNDGIYDKHSVFVDHLVFPRFVTPYGPNAVLTKESNAQELWKFTDTNGDGVADKKELFGTGYGRTGNVEHQESALTWALDNWLYSTFNTFRSRSTPSGIVKETTGSDQGSEWGVTQDDDGKIWFMQGSNGVPSYWQFPIVYGNVNIPDPGQGLPSDARIPWGAPVMVADMQGGMGLVRVPDGSARQTTAGSGGVIVRGDRLPKDLSGKYCYGEPVARMVRCMYPENREGLTYLHTLTPRNEFIKSLDPLFRPVDQKTAPDGTLYIVDMYHGIVQESQWSGPGTYLRARIEQYDLDKVINHGRVWRLVYDGVKPDRSDALVRDRTMPRMNTETAAQLVPRLAHANGWWRDTAQQLLVLKQDKSVVPALQTMARSSTNLLGRFHAMWTLEGLGALDATLARQLMKDPEPRMRIQAMRASETLYKAGDRSFAADYEAATKDSSVDVVIQAMLTMNRWKVPDALTTIKTTMTANQARGVQVVGTTFINAAANAGRGGRGGAALTAEERTRIDKGAEIYNGLCISCHGLDGMGTPTADRNTTLGPPLSGSPRVNGHRDYVINVVLNGLSGAIDNRTYTEVMIPMNANDDEWIASVASYVRRSFGNNGGFVSTADVARVRAENSARKTLWEVEELRSKLPSPIVNDGWKLTASHNADTVTRALNLASWNTGTPQQPGMWFQVELAKSAMVTEIQFESTAGAFQIDRGQVRNTEARGGGGGGGGGGRAAQAGPAAPAPSPGFPRGYKVEVSDDGAKWTAAAEGQGSAASTVITFKPVQAKFVRLTQTASVESAPVWSIQGLRIYEVTKSAR